MCRYRGHALRRKRENLLLISRGTNNEKPGVQPGDQRIEKLGSILGPDSTEHPQKPWYKTQNQAKRFNQLDNRNCFGTRRIAPLPRVFSIVYMASLGPLGSSSQNSFSVPQKSVGVIASDVVVSDAERYNVFERGVRGGAYVSASRVQRFNENRPPKAD